MDIETLYNVEGRAIAYVRGEKHLYLYDGTPVAFLHGEHIYSFNGRYLGWLQDGWVFDRTGLRVFFTKHASGGPVRPVRQVRPIRGLRKIRPIRGVRELQPTKPLRSPHLVAAER